MTLTGLLAGATVCSITEGSCDAATGVWAIGELESAEYRRVRDQHEAATLTLLTQHRRGHGDNRHHRQHAGLQGLHRSSDDMGAAAQSVCTLGPGTDESVRQKIHEDIGRHDGLFSHAGRQLGSSYTRLDVKGPIYGRG